MTWMPSMLLEVGRLSCILLRLVAGRLPTYATGRVDGSRISCFGANFKRSNFFTPALYIAFCCPSSIYYIFYVRQWPYQNLPESALLYRRILAVHNHVRRRSLPLAMYLKEEGIGVDYEVKVHQTVLQQHKAHLHSSSYKWCTIFLISVLYKIPFFCVVQNSFFSVMYNIPDFSDVQYSCFLWCTIFLISVMYNIPLFCDVQYSCFPCSTIFLHNQWCTLVLFIM